MLEYKYKHNDILRYTYVPLYMNMYVDIYSNMYSLHRLDLQIYGKPAVHTLYVYYFSSSTRIGV